jgi:uncharacterized protein YoxC
MIDFFGYRKLLKILQSIHEDINKMVTTLAQLDTALAANTAAVTQLVTDVQALLAKIAASGSPDFTNEVNQVQSSVSALQGADAASQAVLNPPAPAA